MMNQFNFKLLAALLILLITVIAGFIPFHKKHIAKINTDFPIGEAFACGVFLGAGLLHMLGDAANDFLQLGYHYPFAFLLAGTMFLALLLLEHVSQEFYQHRGEHSKSFAIIAVIMLAIHSFLEGSALGLSDNITLVVILVAIVAHKWAASFAIAMQLNKSSLNLIGALLWFALFAIMTPIGVLFGAFITPNPHSLLVPIFTSLAAGTFIYLGTLHGLTRAVMVKRCCNLQHFTFVILGFALMAIVAVWT
jgi:zinc transporter 1/2/3